MLRLDALVDVAAGLEHAQAIGPQDLQHGLLVGVVVEAPHKPRLVYGGGTGHQQRLDVDAGEQGLRERIAQVPRRLASMSRCGPGFCGRPRADLVAEQLVHDAEDFLGEKRPGHVVELLEVVACLDAAAVHLGVPDLESARAVERRERPWGRGSANLERGDRVKEREQAILDQLAGRQGWSGVSPGSGAAGGASRAHSRRLGRSRP